jgi:hypothetical protein
MIYLASPYTHADPWIMEERYLRAARVLAGLLAQGLWTYSPIVHCHELAKIVALPKDAKFWEAYDFAMIAKSDRLLILRIDGWETSRGVAAEKAEAERLGIPVGYI